MAKTDSVLSFLGLCKKAGGLKSGSFLTEEAIKSHKAKLVIVAEDASERSKKDMESMCAYYKRPLYFYGTKESLAKAIGTTNRTAVAITDEHFAKEIVKRLSNR